MKKCLFCSFKKENKEIEHKHAFVILDANPVTAYHSLVIPKRHVKSYFDLTDLEILEIQKLLVQQQKNILDQDPSVKGFNVGINIGETSGQSIFHVHVHLIPRRVGDIKNPKGGVRGVIPEKRGYK